MAHSAILVLEGEALVLQAYHWGITQLTDATSRPQSSIMAGKLSLVLDQLAHPVLDAWMADPHKRLNGEVIALLPNGLGTARRLRFEDALCVEQTMQFTAGGGTAFAGTLSIVLTARVLHVEDGLALDNHWPS